jgi:two-component system, OmpR family, sensor kinase
MCAASSISRSSNASISSVVSGLIFALLGALCLGSLSYFNALSAQVRDRWLPSTTVLGDLNNLTSDHRVAEASLLIAADARELVAGGRQLDELNRLIQQNESLYAQLPRDPAQEALHASFRAQWNEYRARALEVRYLADTGNLKAARELYNTSSRSAYDVASHTFDLLNERNAEHAQEASLRSAAAYRQGQGLIVLMVILALLIMSRLALRRQTRVLRERQAEEQRLMQLQRNFVTRASHEFRTPLTIIDAQAQRLIAMRDQLGPVDIAERAGRVRTIVSRMTRVIRDLEDRLGRQELL